MIHTHSIPGEKGGYTLSHDSFDFLEDSFCFKGSVEMTLAWMKEGIFIHNPHHWHPSKENGADIYSEGAHSVRNSRK